MLGSFIVDKFPLLSAFSVNALNVLPSYSYDANIFKKRFPLPSENPEYGN